MDAATQRLINSATAAVGAEASATVLITGLAQFIRDNANDPVALNAKADELDANNAALAAAVAANPLPGTTATPGSPAAAALAKNK